MASTYIKHPTLTAKAQSIDDNVSRLRKAISDIREHYAIMSSMKDGTNFAVVEEMYGLATGDGTVLYNLLKESIELIDALDGGAVNKLQKLITRVG